MMATSGNAAAAAAQQQQQELQQQQQQHGSQPPPPPPPQRQQLLPSSDAGQKAVIYNKDGTQCMHILKEDPPNRAVAGATAVPAQSCAGSAPGAASRKKKKKKGRKRANANNPPEYDEDDDEDGEDPPPVALPPAVVPAAAFAAVAPAPSVGYCESCAQVDHRGVTTSPKNKPAAGTPRHAVPAPSAPVRPGYVYEGEAADTSKKRKKRKKKGQPASPLSLAPSSSISAGAGRVKTAGEATSSAPQVPNGASRTHQHVNPRRVAGKKGLSSDDGFWQDNTTEERAKIREFWLQMAEQERRALVQIEKEAVLRKMKEQQRQACSCAVCGRRRNAIEEELEVLYDTYYEELENYANQHQNALLQQPHQRVTAATNVNPQHVHTQRATQQRQLHQQHARQHINQPHLQQPSPRNALTRQSKGHPPIDDEEDEEAYDDSENDSEEDDPDEDDEDEDDEEEGEDDDEDDGEDEDGSYDEEEDGVDEYGNPIPPSANARPHECPWAGGTRISANPNDTPNGVNPTYYNFGNSLTVKGGILTVADDLLKNDSERFLEMMERLAERRVHRGEEIAMERDALAAGGNGNGGYDGEHDEEDDEEDDEEYEEDEEEDSMTEEQRLEEGRRMFQIFAARMFEQRVLTAYREKVAQERQRRLLDELEEENRLKLQREELKLKQKEKRKDKKRALRQQKEEERLMKEAARQAEEAAIRAEKERKAELERKRREEERLQAEKERQRKEEERMRKEEEKRRKAREREEKERKEREEREERQRREKKFQEEKSGKEERERKLKERDQRDQQEAEKQQQDKDSAGFQPVTRAERRRSLANDRQQNQSSQQQQHHQQHAPALQHQQHCHHQPPPPAHAPRIQHPLPPPPPPHLRATPTQHRPPAHPPQPAAAKPLSGAPEREQHYSASVPNPHPAPPSSGISLFAHPPIPTDAPPGRLLGSSHRPSGHPIPAQPSRPVTAVPPQAVGSRPVPGQPPATTESLFSTPIDGVPSRDQPQPVMPPPAARNNPAPAPRGFGGVPIGAPTPGSGPSQGKPSGRPKSPSPTRGLFLGGGKGLGVNVTADVPSTSPTRLETRRNSRAPGLSTKAVTRPAPIARPRGGPTEAANLTGSPPLENPPFVGGSIMPASPPHGGLVTGEPKSSPPAPPGFALGQTAQDGTRMESFFGTGGLMSGDITSVLSRPPQPSAFGAIGSQGVSGAEAGLQPHAKPRTMFSSLFSSPSLAAISQPAPHQIFPSQLLVSSAPDQPHIPLHGGPPPPVQYPPFPSFLQQQPPPLHHQLGGVPAPHGRPQQQPGTVGANNSSGQGQVGGTSPYAAATTTSLWGPAPAGRPVAIQGAAPGMVLPGGDMYGTPFAAAGYGLSLSSGLGAEGPGGASQVQQQHSQQRYPPQTTDGANQATAVPAPPPPPAFFPIGAGGEDWSRSVYGGAGGVG